MATSKKTKKRLRSGYTTGSCAAAAAKAAALLLLTKKIAPKQVDILFPDTSKHTFVVNSCQRVGATGARASIIKDAGDDPDVTNGAEIFVRLDIISKVSGTPGNSLANEHLEIIFQAGEGIGTVTKPGLAIPPGEPAINPVPRTMILAALTEVINETQQTAKKISLAVTVEIQNGEALAEKTLNRRLGITGGLSILGTTGIVRPISADAWTATIKASMDVAKENGCSEIVISTGRTSEKAAQAVLALPEEAYAMMGDYLRFSLLEAKDHKFTKIHLSAMWAKIVKAAMKIPQTHVRHGALEADEAAKFISKLANDPSLNDHLKGSNTAREIFQRLAALQRYEVHKLVCLKAKEYAEKIAKIPVDVYLIDSYGKIVEQV